MSVAATDLSSGIRIARLQGRFFRAVERGDALSAAVAFAQFCGVCLNPMTNLRFWREIVWRGFSATYADGVHGAIDGLADESRATGQSEEDDALRGIRRSR